MQLKRGAHLAYCTNVHPGENWTETFASLENYTLAVRDRVCRDQPFAIGLRLSDEASRELINPDRLRDFRRWLAAENCYVFTINGFPFGRFHGGRVKEQVFAPDWSLPARLDFTNRLFDILAALLPDGVEGSVSTLPGSFKGFVRNRSQIDAIAENFWRCIDHIAELRERTGQALHLGVEPEPFGLFENTEETLAFFARMAERQPGDPRLHFHLGVNDPEIKFPAARVASFLFKKRLGLRGLLSVIPLDAKLVRGSHGRMPERAEDWPILTVEKEVEGFGPELPATDVYGIIKRLCLTE